MADPPTTTPTPATPVAALVPLPVPLQTMLSEAGGDSARLARDLYAETQRLSAAQAALQARVAPEGAAVLTGEQATAWAAYQALQLDPAAVAERLGRLTALEQREAVRQAARLHGYSAEALAPLAQGLAIRIDGQRAMVGEETLDAYAQRNWASLLPALRAQPAGTPATPPPAAGTPFPAQGTTPATPPAEAQKALLARFQTARDGAPNPLKKS